MIATVPVFQIAMPDYCLVLGLASVETCGAGALAG
jgi:hypothetical protein